VRVSAAIAQFNRDDLARVSFPLSGRIATMEGPPDRQSPIFRPLTGREHHGTSEAFLSAGGGGERWAFRRHAGVVADVRPTIR